MRFGVAAATAADAATAAVSEHTDGITIGRRRRSRGFVER